jgi:hypothetical protein
VKDVEVEEVEAKEVTELREGLELMHVCVYFRVWV